MKRSYTIDIPDLLHFMPIEFYVVDLGFDLQIGMQIYFPHFIDQHPRYQEFIADYEDRNIDVWQHFTVTEIYLAKLFEDNGVYEWDWSIKLKLE